MAGWTEWQPLSDLYDDDATRRSGVYEIRFVNSKGKPIPVRRLGGIDEEGLYYIGQTGISFRRRLKYYLTDDYPEGDVREEIAETLRQKEGYQEFQLQYRVSIIEPKVIREGLEGTRLEMYLEKFCELPPGNRVRQKRASDSFLGKIKS